MPASVPGRPAGPRTAGGARRHRYAAGVDVLIALAFLVGAVALLFVCGAIALLVFRGVGEARSADRRRRTPLGRLLDLAFRTRR